MDRLFGLRGRVWGLVAIVTVPVFLYSLLAYVDQRSKALAKVEQDFQQLIRSALVEETYRIKHTRDVLLIMANSFFSGGLNPAECGRQAVRLMQGQKDYLNFGAIRPDGTLLCSGLPSPSPQDFSDAPWLKEVLERKAFSQGYYWHGRISRQPGIVFASPLFDASGGVRAVLFANIGLAWTAELAFANRLPPGWEAAIVAPDGEVLFRQPAGGGDSSRLSEDSRLAAFLQTRPSAGMHELTGKDGQSYLYGIGPLEAAGGAIHVVIGAPKATVLANVDRDFIVHLVLLVVLGIGSVLVGQQALNRSFVRWAERLHGNIRRIGAGERELGPQEPSSIRELREIDSALASMVGDINARDMALKASQEHLGLALQGADLGTWDWLVSIGMTGCNPRLAGMLGYRPEGFLLRMENWTDWVHPDDRAQVLAAAEQHLAGEVPVFECECRLRHREGDWVWLFVRGRVVERNFAGGAVRLAGTALDMTARRATEQQLRQRTEELVALVEAMPALVWIARDPACREIVGNRAANAIEGWESGLEPSGGERRVQFRRMDGQEFAPDELPIQTAAAEGRPVQGAQVEVRRADGSSLWLFGNAAPLFDDQGIVRGALGAFVDITQFKASEADLRRHRGHLESLVAERTYELAVAKEAAERANRTKTQFLANVSHELRTPLNSLMLLAHVLSDGRWTNLTPQQREYARMIELSGNDLVQLIDELLDLARIETGRLDIRIEPVPFPDLMQSLRRTHRHVAEQKGLDFKMEIDADVPAAIVTDSARLQQLLRNLLSNAIKFTDRGSVCLRIRRAVSGWGYHNPALVKADAVIAFDVIDTGIGIDPIRQELVLESFGPVRTQAAREEGGTGLGLAISREIATLLGGELGLASIPGRGSTFSVYLPLAYTGFVVPPSDKESGVQARPSEEGSPLAGRTVLVVDDDRLSRYAIRAVLEGLGARVVEAASGPEALEAVSRRPEIDAVLMDVLMPEMDGYQTTRVIRRSLGRKALPIIALTAKAEQGSSEASLAAGCSDHLSKPVATGELLACLRHWLELSPAEA
ncbi:MAG TPA: PAS domain-containing protein [Rhodocyclaceae bacterium]|nr:PAS domain-containing protein [Rhodocyclaceae bacterium]